MSERKGWYGVDFDSTLATYESGDYEKYGPYHLGKPIRKMVDRIIKHLIDGDEVRIFTARISPDHDFPKDIPLVIRKIEEWCEEHLGKPLMVTNIKDHDMILLYDDRCRQVEANTGRIVGETE
jgi:hypothetical protein